MECEGRAEPPIALPRTNVLLYEEPSYSVYRELSKYS